MKKDDCIFCKIAAGEIPSRKIYEDNDLIAIMDLSPTEAGYPLINSASLQTTSVGENL